MKIKNGVNLKGIQLQMRPVLLEAERIWKEHGQELVITAGLEGMHSAGSLHYYGYAVDLRTRYFDKNIIQGVANALKAALNNEYNVIVHSTHIHVEWDKAKYLLEKK